MTDDFFGILVLGRRFSLQNRWFGLGLYLFWRFGIKRVNEIILLVLGDKFEKPLGIIGALDNELPPQEARGSQSRDTCLY